VEGRPPGASDRERRVSVAKKIDNQGVGIASGCFHQKKQEGSESIDCHAGFVEQSAKEEN
jgi:hypothetical protein